MLLVTAITSFNVACVVIVLLGLYCPISKSEKHYPDLVTQDASTCWETNVFATSNDPIYKWVQSSSLANVFKYIDPEKATAAYQRATIWRTISKVQRKSTSDVKLFSSPDVRMLGGVIKPHKTNWIWKMRISWGMSVRVCLAPPRAPASCTWTAPAVYSNNNELGMIMVKVPYGISGDPLKSSYGDHGFFLMNFAGNARSNISLDLGLGMKKAPPLNSSSNSTDDWFRYQVGIDKCSKTAPILYVPDIASYMAYPFLQCACLPSTPVCLIGVSMMETSEPAKTIGPFVFSEEKCASTRSLWLWHISQSNDSENSSSISIPFSSYNLNLDTHVLLDVTLTYAASLSEFNDTTTGLMNNVTMCVENWLEKQESKPTKKDLERMLNDCKLAELVKDDDIFVDNIMPEAVLSRDDPLFQDIVYKRVSPPQELSSSASVTCGIEEGQAELDICFFEHSSYFSGLEEQLKSFAKVTDIHRYGDDLWEKGSSQRYGVYFGFLTTVLTLAVAIAGSCSNQLQAGEKLLFKHVRFRILKSTIEAPAVRTLLRSGIILLAVGPAVYPLYLSIKDIGMKLTLATSRSIQEQTNSEVVFLITTTSTVEVEPRWSVFYAFIALLVACIITVVALIYKYFYKGRKLERKEKRKKQNVEGA